MYEKQLLGRKVRYFRYAPPLTKLDDTSDDRRPNPPYRNAPLYTHSVYYFWWLFIKEHEGYLACCASGGKGEYAQLYADFGDVRGDDFMAWWRSTGRDLFCEPPQPEIEVLTADPKGFDFESRVLLSVPMTGDIQRTVAELRELLLPTLKRMTTKDLRKSLARYQVASKPVLTSLYQHWLAWRARKEHPNASLHELADLAGIAADAGSDGKDRRSKMLKANKIKRYLSGSEELIKNVVLGKFPLFNEEQD